LVGLGPEEQILQKQKWLQSARKEMQTQRKKGGEK
jgi:hypothetical protein